MIVDYIIAVSLFLLCASCAVFCLAFAWWFLRDRTTAHD